MRLFRIEVTFAIIILALTFSIYLHLFFSQDSNELTVFGYSFYHHLPTNEVFAWSFLNPLITICLFSLFYLTSNFKWRILILPLITFYFLELLDVLVFADTSIDKFLNINRLLISIFLIIGLCSLDAFFFRKITKTYLVVKVKDLLTYKRSKRLRQKYYQRTYERNNGEISDLKFIKNLILLKRRLVELVDLESEFLVNRKSGMHAIFLIVFILLIPLFFVNEIFVSGKSSMQFAFLEIESHGFVDIRSLIWYAKNKLILILVLSIWFISTYSWWRYCLLIPLSIYMFQFWEAFQDNRYIEAYGNLSTLPILFIFLVTFVLIGNMARKKIFHFQLLQEIDSKIEQSVGIIVSSETKNS
jgi:hypothetical protein